MTDTDRIMEEAAVWHARTVSDAMDWTGFTLWLESDPRHRHAYDDIVLTDTILGDHAQKLTAAGNWAAVSTHAPNATHARNEPWGWCLWCGLAVAASLVAIIAELLTIHAPQAS